MYIYHRCVYLSPYCAGLCGHLAISLILLVQHCVCGCLWFSLGFVAISLILQVQFSMCFWLSEVKSGFVGLCGHLAVNPGSTLCVFVIVCMWFSLVVLSFVARHLAVSLILQVQHCVFVIICGLVWLCWALWPSGCQSDTPGSTQCVCDCLRFSLVVLGFVAGHLAVSLIIHVQPSVCLWLSVV